MQIKTSLGPMFSGLTLIEVVIVIGIVGILYAVTFWAIKPDSVKKSARDSVRVTGLIKLQSAIENYISDNSVPPDLSGVLRRSDISASPSASPALPNGSGWLAQDLRQYLEKLPTDPLNNGIYFYRYERLGNNYELDAVLENNPAMMANSGNDGDGGNSDLRYEKGTNLDILGD